MGKGRGCSRAERWLPPKKASEMTTHNQTTLEDCGNFRGYLVPLTTFRACAAGHYAILSRSRVHDTLIFYSRSVDLFM